MAEVSRTTIFSARAQNDQKRRFRCQFIFACLKMPRTFALLIQKDRGTGPSTSWQPSKRVLTPAATRRQMSARLPTALCLSE